MFCNVGIVHCYQLKTKICAAPVASHLSCHDLTGMRGQQGPIIHATRRGNGGIPKSRVPDGGRGKSWEMAFKRMREDAGVDGGAG